MKRKHVVKFLPAQRSAAAAVDLKGWWYVGCPGCGLRTMVNRNDAVCQDCSTLGPYGRPLWDRNGDPLACCYVLSAPITETSVLQNFRCGGDTPWWLCSGCQRAHPYDPQDTTRGGRA